MPTLNQVATFNPPSYMITDDAEEPTYIDEDVLYDYGDWEVIDSWEGYEGKVFLISSPTID